jgi:DinB family protein
VGSAGGEVGQTGNRTAIEALGYLLEEAFRGVGIQESNESQALLTNLATVPPEAWRTLPPGASRSIESIALHVGACKIMYDDYAFGRGTLRFGTSGVEPWAEGTAPQAKVIPWLEAAHDRLRGHVAALESDADLEASRLTNWGERRPTRWIVAAMITHDAYHAGEINHLRSILGTDDRWRFVQLGFG